MPHKELCRGDLIEVKSPAEILATLDEHGALAGLPFMPEMVAYCGRRFKVEARAEKVCDTIHYTGSRQLPDSVLLDDLRCNGSGHDGCQAECRFFWKEEWLKRASADDPSPSPVSERDRAALLERATKNSKWTERVDGKDELRYRCQATDLTKCTKHLKLWDPRAYLREVTTGNVPLGRFLRVTARAAVDEPKRKLGLIPDIHVPGTAKKGDKFETLDLQVGETVRVKSTEEIAKTLSPEGRNKGLWFDREMIPFCGLEFRVRQRVGRFVDDHNGKMIVLKNEAITLDNVVCSGDLSLRRWFCPRAIYPYWRECWLERVEPQTKAGAQAG
jgi:hypothetical protein